MIDSLKYLEEQRHVAINVRRGRDASLELLNKYDNPRYFRGECIMDDGHRQIWRFVVGRGYRYAQRSKVIYDERFCSVVDWTSDEEDFDCLDMKGCATVPR